MRVLTIILFALLLYCCADKDGVPVFVIDDQGATSDWNIEADPFKKISTNYFSDIVTESNKRSRCVIIFIEELFSTEDISIKDALGTPYIHLRKSLNENKAKYVPSVSQPYKILTHLYPPKPSNIVYISSADKFELPNKYLNYFFVSFQDSPNASRTQSLRHHDTLMHQIVFKVKESEAGPIIAFYTGKRNPATIEKIDFTIKNFRSENDDIIRSDNALFRLSGVYSETPLRTVRYTEQPEVTRDHGGTEPQSSWTDVAYTDFELRFIFDHTENSWMLSGVALLEGNQVVGATNTKSLNVGAPLGWSNVCAAPIVVRNRRDGSSVTISKYQIQSFKRAASYQGDVGGGRAGGDNAGGDGGDGAEGGDGGEGEGGGGDEGEGGGGDEGEGGGDEGGGGGGDEGGGGGEAGGSDDANTTLASSGNSTNSTNSTCFGKSVNCQPYFNPPILAGLFVTAIFMTILGFAIMFLMDCNSNNRYDDPNGKEIMSKSDLAQTEF